ncbi:MAG: hypothetical protein CTY10_01555 [Methylotenera sp.]|nr:MAG: hypothetical protein CTY10_01555 [Methylotenera sp.]
MNLFDPDKPRRFKSEKPEIFWLSWIFLFLTTAFCFYTFIQGLMLDSLPLLLKGATSISKHENPVGFFLVMAFDLLVLAIMTTYLYLIIEKTKE